MNQTRKPESLSLDWLEILAGITVLIGTAGLIALMATGARAETAKGFQPGNRTFTNPFANTGPTNAPSPPQANPFFSDGEDEGEDDEFYDEDYPQGGGNPANPQVARSGTGTPGTGGPGNESPAGRGRGGGTVSLGGTPPSGVISKSNVQSTSIDTETGEGSKEVVTDFNFPDADIMDIAKALGKLTGKNFILDKDVKGRITIISNSAITVGDAWKAFLTALDINGFALIPSGKYIRVARQRDARDKQLKTYTGDFSPDTDALITRVFPLKYINSEEVARTFRSFMPANSRIIPYEQTNTVIVTDTGSNIAKLTKMLELLDVEGYDAGIEVVPVKYASAAELSKLIDTLLPGTTAAPAGGAPRFGGGGGGSRFSARRTKEGGIINTIIADERTNTLIVNANSKGADQVRELVAKLDQKMPAQAGGGKVQVIYLQFADAEAVAQTLNNLSQGGRAAPPPTGGGTGTNPVATSLFEGAIKISPDKATNSLVVTASPADFVTIQRVINRLDIPRDEVYVEVVIMEVQLNRDFTFSTNVIAPTSGLGSLPNGSELFNFIANPISQQGAILGFKAGNDININVGGRDVTVSNVAGLIKAIQTNSKANVLATPQIIALDNTTAEFESTENIPIPVSTAVQGAGVSTSISKQPIQLAIKIKPQINKISNFVKLDVETKLGDIVNRRLPAAVADQAFATLDRVAKTTVVVGDGDTVVIGGLIRDKTSEDVSKVPLLGDIPLLGWLFRSKTTASVKSNLLVFLTPQIVRQYEKVRAILDKKLKERDNFIENFAGGEDPLRGTRDELIRNLPNIKELAARKPQATVSLDGQEPAPTGGQAGDAKSSGDPFTGGKAPAAEPPASLSTAPGAQAVPAAPDSAAPAPGSDELVPLPPPAGDAAGAPQSPSGTGEIGP